MTSFTRAFRRFSLRNPKRLSLSQQSAMRLSKMLPSGSHPVRRRSSGMCATPSARILRTERPASSCPSTVTRPRYLRTSPHRTSAASFWPLPSTPASPRISPRCTAKETPDTASFPPLPAMCRSETAATSSPGEKGSLSGSVLTEEPTIRREISSSVTSLTSYVPSVLPARITVTRSQSRLISRSLCVMMTMLHPSSLRSRS